MKPTHYADYLRLDQLLSIQLPRSCGPDEKAAHDEMLFIIVHQAHELWFKQILHELSDVFNIFRNQTVDEKNIGIAVSRISRITVIQKVLIEHLRILETMTPLDFLEFRDCLIPASGFQSVQFRLLEIGLGLKRDARVQYSQNPYAISFSPEDAAALKAAEESPSLFDLVDKWLERIPFLELDGFNFWESYRGAVNRRFADDRAFVDANTQATAEVRAKQRDEILKTEQHFEALFDEKMHQKLIEAGACRLSFRATNAALFINLYRDQPILHLPFRLLTLLIDMDELFQTWRSQHAHMVHRMIGTKMGTGGSSGHNYLRATAEKYKIFSDLSNLSTFLIPRSVLPELPPEMRKKLGFYFNQYNN